MNKIIITMESVTYAAKARKLLASVGISSKLIKTDTSLSSSGCTHGILINNRDFLSTVKMLRDSDIPYSVIEKDDKHDIP